ncbi:MAG TPA: hypothetical protein VJ826_11410 [Candidatus Polarisedimenticolaceae bacterium]|nr:hypothetical protein [Candidatus Polarisedimenticolaceae bacterium]
MSGAPERITKPEPEPDPLKEREDSEYAYVGAHEDFEADGELDDGS